MVLLSNAHIEIFRTALRLPAVSCVAYKASWRREALRTYAWSLWVIALHRRRDAQVRRCQVCVKPKRVKLCGYHSVKVKVDIAVDCADAVFKWFENKSEASNEGWWWDSRSIYFYKVILIYFTPAWRGTESADILEEDCLWTS